MNQTSHVHNVLGYLEVNPFKTINNPASASYGLKRTHTKLPHNYPLINAIYKTRIQFTYHRQLSHPGLVAGGHQELHH
jgi:hypothetical protein